MKKSIKNVIRRIIVFVLTLCMITPLVSPFSSAEAESETIVSADDKVAYMIDFTDIPQGEGWCLTSNWGKGGNVNISFNYYLEPVADDATLYVYHINVGQKLADTTTGTAYLAAGEKSSFNFTYEPCNSDIWVSIKADKTTTAKLYIWDVEITYNGNPNLFGKQNAGQYYATVKTLDNTKVFQETTYNQIPFPAYMIDFTGMPQTTFYTLSNVANQGSAERDVKVSFQYYLTGTQSTKELYVHNASGAGEYVPASNTDYKYLQEGQHNYSCNLTRNKVECLSIQMSSTSTAKLYIWDLEFTVGTKSYFNAKATQVSSAVKELVTAGTVFLTALTVQDLPIASSPRTTFDENNIIARFGVVSDTHLSGSWNQARSRAKFAHVIEVMQKVAGTDGEGNTQLDALLINGDLVDAVANKGSNVFASGYGTKAEQNFREVNYVAQGLWGGDNYTSGVTAVTTNGYGIGLDSNVKLLYSLGNHDEDGKGIAEFSNSNYETLYSGYYFAAVLCGWQKEGEYKQYITDVVNYYNENKGTIVVEDAVNKEAVTDTDGTFETAYGVSLASAVDKFHKYYGHDLEAFNDTEGLFYGNRHMKIGDMDVVAIELSTSETSVAFLEKICKTSVAENPNRPIFVMTHYKTDANVLGEDQSPNTDNIAAFEQLLKKYPQIIVWGGHSHSYLHSDAAIDTTNGYVAVDTGVVAYSSQSYLTMRAGAGNSTVTSNVMLAVNAASNENHAQSTGCYVEVDANYNVRIKRIDLYRSYSTLYATNSTLYSSTEFRIYNRAASCTPVDEAVFIREPWDITDINAFGKHLLDYTSDRASNAATPEWTEDAEISLTSINGQIKAEFVMDATVDNNDGDTDTADGLVYMYVVELYDASDQLVDRMYYTNKFYDCSNTTDIPALSAYYIFDNLEGDAGYKVKMYPVSEYGVVGEAIIKEATTRSNSTANFTNAYVINFTTADTAFYTLTSVPDVDSKEVKISFDYYLDGGTENNINLFDITEPNNTNNTNISNSEQKYLKTGRNTVDFTFTGTSSMCLGLQFTNAIDAKLYIWNVNITVDGNSVYSAACQQQSNAQKIPTLTAITYDDISVMENDITGDFSTDVCDLIRMKKYDADEEKETFYMHKGNLEVEDSGEMREYLVEE